MGKFTINDQFSIAVLVYQRVLNMIPCQSIAIYPVLHALTMVDLPRSMIRGGFFIDAESYGEALPLWRMPIVVPT